jgi:hypothetical protein
LAILGAAGMIAVDLVSTAPRINPLSEVSGSIIIAGLALYLAIQVGLLWHFVLRKSVRIKERFDLATLQALLFTILVAVTIVIVSVVLIAQIRDTQIQQVGQSFQTLAQINVSRIRATTTN